MNTLVSFVLLAVCTVAAVPGVLSVPLDKRANFSAACHGTTIDPSGLVLTSTCTNRNGDPVPASLALDSCVGLVHGQLIAGSGFQPFCRGFTLVNPNGPGVVLSAQCTNNEGNLVISGLNLDNFVNNENGVLQCVFT